MWTVLFAIVVAGSVVLSVVAVILRDRAATKPPCGRLPSDDEPAGTKPPHPDLALLENPEVRAVMRADRIDKGELRAELHALAAQLRKNAGPIVTFDRAVHRLRNMSEMMDRLGYDAETLARTDLNVGSVLRACQLCPAEEVCADWLARAPKSFPAAPAFCSNAQRFAEALSKVA